MSEQCLNCHGQRPCTYFQDWASLLDSHENVSKTDATSCQISSKKMHQIRFLLTPLGELTGWRGYGSRSGWGWEGWRARRGGRRCTTLSTVCDSCVVWQQCCLSVCTALVGGLVLILLLVILVLMFVVYRMRKKDEGSYSLDEPRHSFAYTRAKDQEFFAWTQTQIARLTVHRLHTTGHLGNFFRLSLHRKFFFSCLHSTAKSVFYLWSYDWSLVGPPLCPLKP